MNDFEKEVISILQNLDSKISSMDMRLTKVESNINEMKQDIYEMKENMEITRTAANYNGEKLEELITELKSTNTIA